MSHLLARRRKNSANLDVYTGPARSIRPRPIPFEERLPVVFLSQKPQHPEEEQSEEEQEAELDPALIEFLKAQEAEHERFRALCQDRTKADADGKILVPTARPVADYEDTNVPAMQASAPTTYSQLDPINTAYLRYQDMWVRQTVEQVLTGYDVDEEDEAWLAKHNTKACKAIAAQKPSGACTMDATLLETLLTKLELAHFEALQQRGDEWEPEVQAGRIPQLPATEAVLPKPLATAKLRSTSAPPYSISSAYDFWLGKRRRSYRRGPLLQHLWYEEPWKSICFEDPEEPGEQGDMPFCISETRNSTARAAGRHVSDQELWTAMAGVRAEMEALRTLADQVRKRERTKKQLLKAWREQFLPGNRRPNRKLTRLLSTLPLAKQLHPQTQRRKAASANTAAAPVPRVLKGSAVGANLGVQKKRVKGGSSRKGSAIIPESKGQQGQKSKAVQRKQPQGSAAVAPGLKRAAKRSSSSSNSRSKKVRTRLIRRQGVAGTGVGCAGRGGGPRKKGLRMGGRSAMVFRGKAGRGGHWVRREVVEREEREAAERQAAAAAAAAATGGATAEEQQQQLLEQQVHASDAAAAAGGAAEEQGQEAQGTNRQQQPALQQQQQQQQQQRRQELGDGEGPGNGVGGGESGMSGRRLRNGAVSQLQRGTKVGTQRRRGPGAAGPASDAGGVVGAHNDGEGDALPSQGQPQAGAAQQEQQVQAQAHTQTRKRAQLRAPPGDTAGLRKRVRLQEPGDGAGEVQESERLSGEDAAGRRKGVVRLKAPGDGAGQLPPGTGAAQSPFAAASMSPVAGGPPAAEPAPAAPAPAQDLGKTGEGRRAARGAGPANSRPSSNSKASSKSRARRASGSAVMEGASLAQVPMSASGRPLTGAAAASFARKAAATAAAAAAGSKAAGDARGVVRDAEPLSDAGAPAKVARGSAAAAAAAAALEVAKLGRRRGLRSSAGTTNNIATPTPGTAPTSVAADAAAAALKASRLGRKRGLHSSADTTNTPVDDALGDGGAEGAGGAAGARSDGTPGCKASKPAQRRRRLPFTGKRKLSGAAAAAAAAAAAKRAQGAPRRNAGPAHQQQQEQQADALLGEEEEERVAQAQGGEDTEGLGPHPAIAREDGGHVEGGKRRKLGGAVVASAAAPAAAARRAQEAPTAAASDRPVQEAPASAARRRHKQDAAAAAASRRAQEATATAGEQAGAHRGRTGGQEGRRTQESTAAAGEQAGDGQRQHLQQQLPQRRRQDASGSSRPPAAHVLLPASKPPTRRQQQQQQQQSPPSNPPRHSHPLPPPPLLPLAGSAVARGLSRSLRSHPHPSSNATHAHPPEVRSGKEDQTSLQGAGCHVQEDRLHHRLQGGVRQPEGEGHHLQGEQHHVSGGRTARGHTPAAPSIWTRIVQGLGLAASNRASGGRGEGSGTAADRVRGAAAPEGVGGSQDSPGSPGGRKKRTLGGAAAAAAERRAQQQQVDGALAGEEGGQQRRAAGEEEEHDALPQSPVFWSKSKRRLGGAAAASAAAAAARRAHEQHLQQQQQQQQGEKGGSGHGESEDDILEEAKGATAGRLGSEQGLQGRGREGERKSTRGQALAKREGVSGTHHRGANADTSRAAKETSAMGDLRPVKNTRQQQQQQRQPHRRSAAAAAAAAGAAKRTLDTPAVVDSEEEEFVGGGSSSSDSSDSDSGLQGVGLSRESTDEGMSDVSSEGGVNESSDSGAWEDNEEGARRADRTSGADGRKGRRQGSVARGGRLKSRGGSGALGLGSAAGAAAPMGRGSRVLSGILSGLRSSHAAHQQPSATAKRLRR